MKLRCFGFLYNPTNPKFYLFSLISSCSRSPPQPSFSSLSLQAVAVLPHNLLSFPFLLVSQKLSSRIPKMFNQKKRKKKIQSF